MKKQKKYFIYSIIIVLFTALFFSCKNDIENVAASITGSPDDEVAAAQEWYNKTQQDTLAIGIARVSSSKTKFSAKPDWKHAYSVKDDDYSAVHTPLSTKERFSFVTAENKQAYEATGDARYISTFTQMVVINEKKDNKTYAFLMTLVPDKAYLESTHFAAFSSNYRKWQKGYSGYVFYHTLDGKFNNGWKFENGKVTMSATQVDENGVDISMGAKRKVSSGTICTTLTLDFWEEYCFYQYGYTEHNGVQNSPNSSSILQYCSWDKQACLYMVVCYDDGNSAPPTTSGGVPGSTNGGYVAPPTTLDTYLTNALVYLLSKLTGNMSLIFQNLINLQKIFFVPTTTGTSDPIIFKYSDGTYQVKFNYNPTYFDSQTFFGQEVICIHEMYHIYRETNPSNIGTDNDIDHSYMISDPQYLAWLKEAFPGCSDSFYNDLRYAGTIGTPAFYNLPQAEQARLIKFFEDNNIPH